MKFRAMTGLNFSPGRRVEAGEIVSDVPAKSVKWLQEQGLIEPLQDDAPTAKSPKTVMSDADQQGKV